MFDTPSLDDLFRASRDAHPHAPAIQDGTDRVDYAELDDRVATLAVRLAAEGVRPGDRVIVSVARSTGLIVAVLATSRVGAVTVPLAPDLPARRLRTVCDLVQPAAVMSGDGAASHLPPGTPATVIDRAGRPAGTAADRAPVAIGGTPDAAYIVFTSGSSGTPKGVVVGRDGLGALRQTMARTAPSGPGDRTLLFSSVGFDVLIWELLWSLGSGAELVVVPDDERIGAELVDFLVRERITHAAVPPAVVGTWPDDATLPEDFVLVVGTETMSWSMVERWARRVTLVNAYGPSEATVNSTLWVCDPARRRTGPVPIGVPDVGKRVLVVDDRLDPVAPGDMGEILVGGVGVALGYLGPGGTVDADPHRFPVTRPGDAGERVRWFRTGDRGRWSSDGLLEFHGRIDDQVQIGGFRVEPGEVANALCDHPDVTDAVTLGRERHTGVGTELVAFATTGDSTRTGAELRAWLHDRLPRHAVPARVLVTDRLPRTDRDKVDKAALLAIDTRPLGRVTPAGPDTVGTLRLAFAEVLGLDEVGADDNFFALGGDSVAALTLLAHIRRLGVARMVRDLMDAPTPAGLAVAAPAAPNERPTGPVTVPPTPVIRHLLALQRDPVGFGQALVVEVPPVPVHRLATAWAELVDRHDALRLQLQHTETGPVLRIGPAPAGAEVPVIDVIDVADIDEHDLSAELRRAVAGLRPADGGMSALRLVRGRAGRTLLVITAHHIAVDLVSWNILVPEFAALVSGGQERSRASTFADWATLLAGQATSTRTARETDHWRRVLAGPDAAQSLLGDRDTRHAMARCTVSVDADRMATLRRWAHGRGLGPADVTRWAVCVAIWRAIAADQPGELLVELESHGRSTDRGAALDLGTTVGWFTSMFPIRLAAAPEDVAGADRPDVFLAAAAMARARVAATPDLGIGYGLLRHGGGPDRLAGLPRPRILLNDLGQFEVTGLPAGWRVCSDHGLAADGRDIGGVEPEHDLVVTAVTTDRGLTMSWEWRGDTSAGHRVTRAATRCLELLSTIASSVADVPTAASAVSVRVGADDLARWEDLG